MKTIYTLVRPIPKQNASVVLGIFTVKRDAEKAQRANPGSVIR